ncbi:MAG: hypothetical protein IPG50_08265 [Myxococcales bacterium]|nr:hypothetical protein [Myxococcales bacterium]
MRPLSYVLSLVALVTLAAACGRPATEADCKLIVDRNVEVQMRAMKLVEPGLIAKKQEELRASLKDELKDCVGRRVTDSMMGCVREAETAEAITKCIR